MDFVQLAIDAFIDSGSLSAAFLDTDQEKIGLLALQTILSDAQRFPDHVCNWTFKSNFCGS